MESSIRSVPRTFPKETDVTHVHVSTEEHIGVPTTYVVSEDAACLRKSIESNSLVRCLCVCSLD